MSHTRRGALAAIAAVVICTDAHADRATMARPHYTAARQAIVSASRASRAGCDTLRANAKAVCIAEAVGRENVALAELEARYKPGERKHYDVYVATAQAAHAVARAKCNDLVWRARDVCTKRASDARAAAFADARRRMKTELAARAEVRY